MMAANRSGEAGCGGEIVDEMKSSGKAYSFAREMKMTFISRRKPGRYLYAVRLRG